jgi:LmbE family N-acetylglucosaminyl deacetylase
MRVLAIGAHPDDIEIGCGGTLLWHKEIQDEIQLLVMTDDLRSGDDSRLQRRFEAQRSAEMLGAELTFGGLPDKSVEVARGIEVIEAVASDFGPDLVYAHDPRDTHQDHRSVGYATLSAFRRQQSILLYRSLTSRSPEGNVFTDIDPFIKQKMELVAQHASQVQPAGFIDLELLVSIARATGHAARTKHAESFHAERLVLTTCLER